jgi:hypothetical protein
VTVFLSIQCMIALAAVLRNRATPGCVGLIIQQHAYLSFVARPACVCGAALLALVLQLPGGLNAEHALAVDETAPVAVGLGRPGCWLACIARTGASVARFTSGSFFESLELLIWQAYSLPVASAAS